MTAAFPVTTYNGGRLVSYLLLGALAGTLGSGIDRLGALAQVSRLAAVVAGALLALWGANALLAALGVRSVSGGVPRLVQVGMGQLLVRLRDHSPTARGLATGLLTTLLPCGWLYAFVATAGGTGNIRDAMLVMLFFWLGTLPIMVAIGTGVQRVFGVFQRRLPLAAAGVAVIIGVLTMIGRLSVHTDASGHDASHVVEVGRASR